MAVSTAEFAAGSCVQLLTPEERAQAIEAFEDGDTDGTGKLDIDLLLETLVAAGHFVPEEHSGTILQLGDVDKNGDLDLNEFLELVGFLRSIAIAFQALGPQGGGRVERSALPLALRRFGWELDAEQHLALYRLCEAESSSLVEFSQVFKCILFLRLAQLLFEIADADKSGKLEFGELCELLPGIGVNKPEVEVRAVFESLDVDKSGELDFHEFLSLVLSVCTDQVRQLDATSE